MPQYRNYSPAFKDVKLCAIDKMPGRQVFEKLAVARWGSMDSIACPKCGHVGPKAVRPHRSKEDEFNFRCRQPQCSRVFRVTCGTAFDRAKLSSKELYKIFASYAIKADMTAVTLMEDNDFSLKTANFVMHRLRSALAANHDRQGPFGGHLEIDGAIFCHRIRNTNRKADQKANTTARKLESMQCWVIALIETEAVEGNIGRKRQKDCKRARRIKVFVVDNERKINVGALLSPHISGGSVICTDGMLGYMKLERIGRKNPYPTRVFQVDHNFMFQTPDGVNENIAESFFGLLRGMVGCRHGISPTYMAEYAKEAAWRRTMNNQPASVRLADLARICLTESFNHQLRGYTRGSRRQDYELYTMENRRANGVYGRRLSAARRPLEPLERIATHDRRYRLFGGGARRRRREPRDSNGGCRSMAFDAHGNEILAA